MAEIRAEKTRRAAEAEREFVRANSDQIRGRCVTLAGFVREAWHVIEPGRPYVHGWHIDAICRHLEAITSGELLAHGRDNRLLINVPPGTMKSLLVSVFWPAWEWTKPELRSLQYLTTSYSETYAKRDARRMRDLVSSEWYRALWPVELSRSGEMSFANTARGSREALPFASLTGGRGDRVIIDDPHSTETAESEAERERTTRIFRESVTSRLNDARTSAIVVIMQRLHEQDVSGQALALQLGYTHLMLPMEFEPERRCETIIGFSDPRNSDGDLLFPERFPRETVERDKVPLGSYAYAGQYQQRPAPREGGLFKRHWFKPVGAVPLGSERVRKWDLASSTTKDADYTVGLLMARDPAGFYYVEDVIRKRLSPAGVEEIILGTAAQEPGVPIHLNEDPAQAGKFQAQYLIRALAGYTVRAQRETGSKEVRASPFAAQAEAGNVRMVKALWNDAFLDELTTFPAGSHDDQVDAASGAFNMLVTPKFEWYVGS